MPHSIKHQLDLRQELLNVNSDYDTWLGKSDENQQSRLSYEIPLRRSVSLDGGKDIFDYLHRVGSEWSASSEGSTWTMYSEAPHSRMVEQYRSFEDIPVSQIRVKNRHVSTDYDSASGSNVSLSALKDECSDRDVGSASVSPQVKKLKWNLSLSNFDNYKESYDYDSDYIEDESRSTVTPYFRSISIESSKSTENIFFSSETCKDVFDGGQSSFVKRLRLNTPSKNSLEELKKLNTSSQNSAVRQRPYYRSKSTQPDITKAFHNSPLKDNERGSLPTLMGQESRDASPGSIQSGSSRHFKTISFGNFRQPLHKSLSTGLGKLDGGEPERLLPRFGLRRNTSFQAIRKSGANLRKEVLKQSLGNYRSCEDIAVGATRKTYHSLSESNTDPAPGFKSLRESYKVEFEAGRLDNLESNIYPIESVPAIAVKSPSDENVAKNVDGNITVTSNLVDVSSNCGCQVCMEEEKFHREKTPLREILRNVFFKIVSCRDYSRMLTYWDENNNLEKDEMYVSVIHVLKLLFGLWLRHLDHN